MRVVVTADTHVPTRAKVLPTDPLAEMATAAHAPGRGLVRRRHVAHPAPRTPRPSVGTDRGRMRYA